MIDFMDRINSAIDRNMVRLRALLTLAGFLAIENVFVRLASVATLVAAVVG